jgi:hypothetical protein
MSFVFGCQIWFLIFIFTLFSFLFHHLSLCCIVIGFMIFFSLLSIGLSWYHELSCEFRKLTRVASSFFLNWYCFFNFIIQHWVHWKLSFMIFFYLLSMGLSWYCDHSSEFNMLSQVVLYHFFCIFLNLFYFFKFILQH